MMSALISRSSSIFRMSSGLDCRPSPRVFGKRFPIWRCLDRVRPWACSFPFHSMVKFKFFFRHSPASFKSIRFCGSLGFRVFASFATSGIPQTGKTSQRLNCCSTRVPVQKETGSVLRETGMALWVSFCLFCPMSPKVDIAREGITLEVYFDDGLFVSKRKSTG